MCVAALGGIISGMASVAQGMAQASAYKAQAAASKLEAKMLREQGAYEAGRLVERGKRLVGQQVAGYSAEGVSVLDGSPLEVIVDTETEIQLDRAAIMVNAENGAKMKEYEAKIANMNAKSAKIGGILGGVAAVVGAMPTGGGATASTSTGAGIAPTLTSAYTRKPVSNFATPGTIPQWKAAYG